MIIAQIMGGLGNQLFQYAAARALAVRTSQSLKLDLSSFKTDKLRTFLLDQYQIPVQEASKTNLFILRVQRSKLGRIPLLNATFAAIDESKGGDLLDFCTPNAFGTYVTGYWQSEKYFKDLSQIIRSELQLKCSPSPVNAETLKLIRATEAVSLHVRRGDYVTNPKTAAYHGVCDLDYYQNAVQTIASKVQNPHFFIFSDDIAWTKSNLHIHFPITYIDHNADMPCEDLRLMSLCDHFIIANSSFSWWGAWLSNNPSKIVISPKNWFLNAEKDDRDLIPENWIRI